MFKSGKERDYHPGLNRLALAQIVGSGELSPDAKSGFAKASAPKVSNLSPRE